MGRKIYLDLGNSAKDDLIKVSHLCCFLAVSRRGKPVLLYRFQEGSDPRSASIRATQLLSVLYSGLLNKISLVQSF